MGLELTLLPFPQAMLRREVIFSHTLLPINRFTDLTDQILHIQEEHGREVPDDFHTFLSREEMDGFAGDPQEIPSHYGIVKEDAYDEPLQYVPASCLKSLSEHPRVQDDTHNRAVWAYLCALPDDYAIALYWN